MPLALTLAFILELIAFAGFAAVAFYLPLQFVIQIILCILLLVSLIAFWSVYMAPKAVNKFNPKSYYTAKIIIYTVAAFAIFKVWSPTFGVVFIILCLVDELFLYKHNLKK